MIVLALDGERRSDGRFQRLGATKLFEMMEGDHYHVTMSDPGGNGFLR
jgi:hypothetical protein